MLLSTKPCEVKFFCLFDVSFSVVLCYLGGDDQVQQTGSTESLRDEVVHDDESCDRGEKSKTNNWDQTKARLETVEHYVDQKKVRVNHLSYPIKIAILQSLINAVSTTTKLPMVYLNFTFSPDCDKNKGN